MNEWQCNHILKSMPIVEGSDPIPCAKCRLLFKAAGASVTEPVDPDGLARMWARRAKVAKRKEKESEVMNNKKPVEKIVTPKVLQFDITELGHEPKSETTEQQEGQAEALHQRLGSFTSSDANRHVVTNPDDEVVRVADNWLEPHQERDAFEGVLERTPYGIEHGEGVQPTLRIGPNYLPSGDAGIVEPLNFKAPQPGPVRKFKGLGGGLFSNLIKKGDTSENGR